MVKPLTWQCVCEKWNTYFFLFFFQFRNGYSWRKDWIRWGTSPGRKDREDRFHANRQRCCSVGLFWITGPLRMISECIVPRLSSHTWSYSILQNLIKIRLIKIPYLITSIRVIFIFKSSLNSLGNFTKFNQTKLIKILYLITSITVTLIFLSSFKSSRQFYKIW